MANGRFDEKLDMPFDKAIEAMVSGFDLGFDKEFELQELRRLLSQGSYQGNIPHIRLRLHDILGDELPDGLALGIRGFEESNRSPSVLVELEHPEQLVSYAMATADSLDEIVALQDALLTKGHILRRWGYAGFSMDSYFVPGPKISLVPSIITVSDEIISRLGHVTEDSLKELTDKNRSGFLEQWVTKKDAYKSRAYAFQAVIKDFESPSDELEAALTAVQAYEEFTGAYTDDLFRHELMEAYFRRKYSTTAPSTGEIPEELKAEHNWMHSLFTGMNWDQFFRDTYFGRKEDPWKKREEEATRKRAGQSEEEARQRRYKHLEDWINDLMRDPWERHQSELDLLGINSKMSYQEARAKFLKGIKQRRETFIRQDINAGGYKKANDELAAYITAWRALEPIYKIRDAKESAKAEPAATPKSNIDPSLLGTSTAI